MNSSLGAGLFSAEVFEKFEKKLSPLETWGYGFLFVTIINLSSVMGILFFPLMKKSFYKIVMRSMIGLAIGSLSGSALFHLIPQAFGLSGENHTYYISISSFIWLAIWIIMLLECSIKIIVKSRANKRKERRRELALSSLHNERNLPHDFVRSGLLEAKKTEDHHNNDSDNSFILPNEADKKSSTIIDEGIDEGDSSGTKLSNSRDLAVYHSTFSLNLKDLKDEKEVDEMNDKSIKTVAWIVIIGDSIHNFIDGVSIGAGFTQSFSTGLILSLAVIFEEFPHELGDFAILINSGLSVKKAIFFNFLSALTCYLGLFLGILLGKIEYENYIFAFAAGIFLYVSLVDMIPEVTSLVDECCEKSSPKKAWLVLLNHNIGIILGITILYTLANYSP